jgi:SAM-dependent methyltransferase
MKSDAQPALIPAQAAQTRMTIHDPDVRAFFETSSYLDRNAGIAARTRLVQRMLGPISNSRILDLGCGDGSLSLPFLESGNSLTLVDFSTLMIDRARSSIPLACLDRVELVQRDISDFRPDQEYDVALCVGVLAHVPSVSAAVSLVSLALKPGGRAVFQISDSSLRINRFLKQFSALRRRLTGQRCPSVNRISSEELASLAAVNHLEHLTTERYAFGYPGTRLIPFRLRRAFELFAVDHSLVAQFGLETMFLFRRAQ